MVFVHGLPKAGPTGAGVEFHLGIEQRLAAANTLINAWRFRLPVGPGKSRFRSFLSGNTILLGGQLLPPLCVRFPDFVGHIPLGPFANSLERAPSRFQGVAVTGALACSIVSI